MAKGISLHIGLNRVDPASYAGWSGDLAACEFDAKDMAAIAKKQGFQPRSLYTKKATADAVVGAIEEAAGSLTRGDAFFLTYSGHGGSVPDGNSDEPDRRDETWVLYDRQLVDDELFALWSKFQPGVRITVLSDSCHSGTAVRAVRAAVKPSALAGAVDLEGSPMKGMKAMPPDVVPKAYKALQGIYDKIQESLVSGDNADVSARVVLLSGCQDNQTSADGRRNGLFTGTMRTVWNGGRFKGGYKAFHRKIVEQMPPWQSPNYFTVNDTGRAFERERPFTI